MKKMQRWAAGFVPALSSAAFLTLGLGINGIDCDGDGFVSVWSGGDDCDDSDPSVNPGAVELCNGMDDNCDGQADETFDCSLGDAMACVTGCGSIGEGYCNDVCMIECSPPMENVCNAVDDDCDGAIDESDVSLISNSAGQATEPDIEWSGPDFGIVWHDTRSPDGVYYSRVPHEPTGSPSNVLIYEDLDEPSLAWAEFEFGLAATGIGPDSQEQIVFQRFDQDGGLVGGSTEIRPTLLPYPHTRAYSMPRLVWTGTNYGLLWEDRKVGPPPVGDSRFMQISGSGFPGGVVIGDGATVVHLGTPMEHHDLAWSGTGYGYAYHDAYGYFYYLLRFRTLDEYGATTSLWAAPLSGPETGVYAPSVVWVDDKWVLAYVIQQDDMILVAVHDAGGARLGSEEVTVGDQPDLVWNGEFLAMAWNNGGDIFFGVVDFWTGTVTAQVQVTMTAGTASHPDLAWSGTEFGLTWQDAETGSNQIYFTSLHCEP